MRGPRGRLDLEGAQVWISDRLRPRLGEELRHERHVERAVGPASKVAPSASRPWIAAQLVSATTATPLGTFSFTAGEVAQLDAIFPDGVCDYTKPDQGRPEGWGERGQRRSGRDGGADRSDGRHAMR